MTKIFYEVELKFLNHAVLARPEEILYNTFKKYMCLCVNKRCTCICGLQ